MKKATCFFPQDVAEIFIPKYVRPRILTKITQTWDCFANRSEWRKTIETCFKQPHFLRFNHLEPFKDILMSSLKCFHFWFFLQNFLVFRTNFNFDYFKSDNVSMMNFQKLILCRKLIRNNYCHLTMIINFIIFEVEISILR